jgi:hypothetical protein
MNLGYAKNNKTSKLVFWESPSPAATFVNTKRAKIKFSKLHLFHLKLLY